MRARFNIPKFNIISLIRELRGLVVILHGLIGIFIILTIPQNLQAQSDTVEVGVILANLFNERWQRDKDFIEERVLEKGGKVTFKDCYNQPENQVAAAWEFVEQGVDAVIIVAVDAVAAAPVVTICKAANIPVMAYDRLILDAPLDHYITFNSVKAGEIKAQAVVDRLPKGKVLYLGGPSDDHNSVLIRQGVFNVLDQHKRKYQVISTQVISWTELDAYLTLNDVLSNEGMVPDAIICGSDVLTRGAIAVLDEQKLLGKVLLTGQDAELDICRYIARDEVTITIYKPGKQLAYRAVDAIFEIVAGNYQIPGETIDNGMRKVPAITLDPIPVTKETLEQTVISDGYYTKEQIYNRKLR